MARALALANKIPTVFEFNDQRVFLEFNETFVLLNSVGRLKLDFKDTNTLDNAEFHFVFSDDVPENQKPFSWNLFVENGGNRLVYTFYQWYGIGVESPEPFKIADDHKVNTWSIKLSTTADKVSSRRTVNIAIWRIL
jgi:hypothetical protein